MFLPKDMATRMRLHSARILRPDKKDILDLHLPFNPATGVDTYLILADVSNFTGSFANSWLMLHCMSQELAGGRLEDRYQLFSVGDHFVAGSWKELLILYVYLAVGVPCWVESHERFAYLSGGFLGIGGNITIGLLCLAVILQETLNHLLPKVHSILAQAGGDDIAIMVQCDKRDLEGAVQRVRSDLSRYVGKLKELSVLTLNELHCGIVPDATFCKKRIVLMRADDCISLIGEPSVPLPESLFPDTIFNRLDLQIKAWHELDYSLQKFDAALPGHKVLLDTLRQLFLERHRQVRPERVRSTKRLTSFHRVVRYGGFLITDCALKIALDVPVVRFCGITALGNPESQLLHALKKDRITMTEVVEGEDRLELVCMTKREAGTLSRTRFVERVVLNFDIDLLDRLCKIVSI
jgi:hypothetical protein